MTQDEFKRLKVGDTLRRIVSKGQSDPGYETKVFSVTYNSGTYLKIRHQNGAVDSVFPSYWELFEKKRSGFAKFIKRVEA